MQEGGWKAVAEAEIRVHAKVMRWLEQMFEAIG